jgi:Bacteriophage baseplate protein W
MNEQRSIALPFRVAADVASASGRELLAAKVRHVLLSQGEMPWRANLGAGLDRLRHRRADAITLELVRVRVRDALARWLPSVQLVRIDVVANAGVLTVQLDVQVGDAEASLAVEVAA